MPVLSNSLVVFELLLKRWAQMKELEPTLMPFIQPGVAKIEDYYNKVAMHPAFLMAICMYFQSPYTHTDLLVDLHPKRKLIFLQSRQTKDQFEEAKAIIAEQV
jgi:hypothetical protein